MGFEEVADHVANHNAQRLSKGESGAYLNELGGELDHLVEIGECFSLLLVGRVGWVVVV